MTFAFTTPLGVYVHFPYCRQRCPYCDFAIHVRRRLRHRELAAAVIAELGARAPVVAGRRLVSIYFGGGTPSLWEPACVAEVIAAVRACPGIGGGDDPDLEVTLEANPDDLPRQALEDLRAAGVNRLSLGAQSMSPARLVELGRSHSPEAIRAAVEHARAAGFRSLSLDLIYGLPGQGGDELAADVDALVALGPDHLSAYQLTVEERTPFGARSRAGQLHLPGGDEQAERFALVSARLGAAGLAHYEISSFARPGHEAVHNALYWSGGEWLGLGPAAHSFRYLGGDEGGGGERWQNPRNVDRYIARWLGPAPAASHPAAGPAGLPLAGDEPTRERLTADELAREGMWLGLRQLLAGVDRAAFARRFGEDPVARFAAIVGPLVEAGLLEVVPARVRLTPRGALLADEVALRFL